MSEPVHWTWLLGERGLSYERWLWWHCYALLPLQPTPPPDAPRLPERLTLTRQAPVS